MSLLRKLVLVLALGALLSVAIVFGLRYYFRHYRQPSRPDFAKVGGTVLIYEVDTEQSPPDYDPDELAAALHRRLDHFDWKGIIVSPAADHRVEIRVPRGGLHHNYEVGQVKDLLAENGKLEFRVLANSEDDRLVFDSIQNNPEEQRRLKASAADGESPPAPRPIAGDAFDSDLGSFTYTWVELGREERAIYKLNDDDAVGEWDGFWQEMAQARKDHKAVLHTSRGGTYGTNLFYSREVTKPDRLPEKDRGKKYEYFILTRDPERDEDGRPKAVTGEFIRNAYPTYDQSEREAIGFELNTEGAARLKGLTAANKDRQLAIILDGVIRSAPNVLGPIEATGIITGDFTHQEVDRLTNILRAGSLPVILKPQPISETTVEPRK